MSLKEFADAVEMSEPAIRDLEKGRTTSTYPKNFRKMADIFGFSLDEARSKLTPQAELDSNIEPYGSVDIPFDIPFFDLPVAASGWEDVIDNESASYRVTADQVRQGLFRVRVRGDSMEPKIPDGSIVEFRLIKTQEGTPDCSSIRVGKNYYVQLDDGTGTFKQVESCENDVIYLKAINKRYKKLLEAPVERVQRLAIMVGVFIPESDD